MFERFTDRARRVVVLAQEEARSLDHNYIGTEHLLLGLIHEGQGVAAKAMESLGISLEAVRAQVEEIIGRGQFMPSGHIPFTPRAKTVLELSLRAALELGHNYIGTEHILLGLVREGEGVAAQVLVRLGADLDRVRLQVIQLLHGYQGFPVVPEPAGAEAPEGAGGAGAAGQRLYGPVGQWAAAHARSIGGPGGDDQRKGHPDAELRASIAGLPLLCRAGVIMPLALLLDLVRLTGSADAADAKLGALASQAGMGRLRLLAWPPNARVALAGLLAADLRPDPRFSVPSASLADLRDALAAAVSGGDIPDPRQHDLGEIEARIAQVRLRKERALDAQDFEKAAAFRDTEKQLIAQMDALRRQPGAPVAPVGPAGDIDVGARGHPDEPEPWQAGRDVVDALTAATARVTDRTVAMLEILGSAASAAEPALPLRVRDRVCALPSIGARERRLITDSVSISMDRSTVTTAALGSVSGTTGVSRRGKVTGLLPGQLALPEDLLEYRFASRELLYRVSEADAQPPPEAVTVVLDTTPPTYGPVEIVLRLVAHIIAVTLWAVRKVPTVVSLDRPALAWPVSAPADLATLWTARTLDPPDVRAGLATARRLGEVTILLTEHHLVSDRQVIPHRGLRVLTTHAAGDPPARRPSSPFHLHLPPDPNAGQVARAVRELLGPTGTRRAS